MEPLSIRDFWTFQQSSLSVAKSNYSLFIIKLLLDPINKK